MEIAIVFENGKTFDWKRVRASELPSIFTDISTLTEKDESARKAFKGQSRLNGTKKRKVNKSK
jgi:hypothetical protein